jgi:O-antigen ligase
VRVRGIFIHPAILGTVMTMGFFAAWHHLSHLRSMAARAIQLTLLAVTPITLYFTLTRSVYAGFAAALAVGAIWSRRLRPLCVGLVLAAMVGVFLNWDNLSTTDRQKGGMGTVGTVHTRIMLAYCAAEVFADNPFFGCGFMNFSEVAQDYVRPRDVPMFGHIDTGFGTETVPHNILMTIIAEQGLLGAVPFFLIFFFMWRGTVRAFQELPREGVISRDFVVCVWCAIAAYLVNAMFIEMRYFEYVNVLFFFLMGMSAGMLERHRARKWLPESAPDRPAEATFVPVRSGGAA